MSAISSVDASRRIVLEIERSNTIDTCAVVVVFGANGLYWTDSSGRDGLGDRSQPCGRRGVYKVELLEELDLAIKDHHRDLLPVALRSTRRIKSWVMMFRGGRLAAAGLSHQRLHDPGFIPFQRLAMDVISENDRALFVPRLLPGSRSREVGQSVAVRPSLFSDRPRERNC